MPKTIMMHCYNAVNFDYGINYYNSSGETTSSSTGGSYFLTLDSNDYFDLISTNYDNFTIVTINKDYKVKRYYLGYSENKIEIRNTGFLTTGNSTLEEVKDKIHTIDFNDFMSEMSDTASGGIGSFRIYETLIPESEIYDILYRKTIISNDNKMRNIYYSEGASATSLSQVDGTCFVKGELIEQDGKVSINKNGNIYASEFIEF